MSWDVTASNDSGGSGEIPPAGNHPAALVALIDLGTHEEEYQGKRYTARKALLCFELTTERQADGTPFVMSQELAIYQKMTKKSKLRLFLEGWRGRPLDDKENVNLITLLGKKCLANVTHAKAKTSDKEYAKLAAVTPVPKGMSAPEPSLPVYSWTFGQGPREIPTWVPWLYGRDVNDVIGESFEARGLAVPTYSNGKSGGNANSVPVGAGVGAADDNDIPF